MSDRERISVADLPEDVFLLILDHLAIWEILKCQLVSRSWREAFSKNEYLRITCRRYPQAREMRDLPVVNANHTRSLFVGAEIDWAPIFRSIAIRYFHLRHGRARKLVRHRLSPTDQTGDWYPVGQWDYHESQPGGKLYYETGAGHLSKLAGKPYLFRPTLWSYDDGLVVYAPSSMSHVVGDGEKQNERVDSKQGRLLCLLDVDSDKHFAIPFNAEDKLIRNIRLKSFVLVIEWAEKNPYHDLNAVEKVHRHFTTCFDVRPSDVQNPNSDPGEVQWEVVFRSEWKIHFLGLPLSSRDHFFSVHTAQHYSLYLWQPNRSMYTGDEDMPIEALFVWDISRPSSYRPSSDPGGKFRPMPSSTSASASSGSVSDGIAGPHMVARFSFRELDYLGIRQHSNIALLSLSLHSETCSLVFRENVCVEGQGYFDPAERLWCAKTTTFPFLGAGPCLRREYDSDLPPYRGHCSMESTALDRSERWFLPIMDVHDAAADVRMSLVETCFTGFAMPNELVVRIKALDEWKTLEDKVVKELAVMGRIAGDERWLIGQNARMELVVAKFQ